MDRFANTELTSVAAARTRVRNLRAAEEFSMRAALDLDDRESAAVHRQQAEGLSLLLEELTDLHDWLLERHDAKAYQVAA